MVHNSLGSLPEFLTSLNFQEKKKVEKGALNVTSYNFWEKKKVEKGVLNVTGHNSGEKKFLKGELKM